jgi:hypothetical protein
VLPVVPLILFAFIIGIYYGINYILSIFKKELRFSVFILLILGFAFITPIKKLHLKASNDYPRSWKNYFMIASWFKKEGMKEVVVICRKPILFHLKSGTFTSTYKYSNNEKEVLEDLENKQTDYVVLDNLGYRQTYEYLLPAINNNKERFQVILKLDDPDTYLLKFTPAN